MKLKILVGTVTCNAEHVAQAIQMTCTDLVSVIEIQRMDNLNINVFNAEKGKQVIYLVCTSTYGAGDVPDNAQELYDSLDTEPRFLGHVRYGLMALGDQSSYPETFCFGGKKFDERLQGLGAQRIGEIWCHDAGSSVIAEKAGAAWCRQWLSDLLQPSKPIYAVT